MDDIYHTNAVRLKALEEMNERNPTTELERLDKALFNLISNDTFPGKKEGGSRYGTSGTEPLLDKINNP